MNLDKIFLSLLVFDLGTKIEYAHIGFGYHHTEVNDILECNMTNDTNSIGIKLIKWTISP